MKHRLPILFAVGTAICWGLYGPILTKARHPGLPPLPPPEGWSAFKPYVGIGLAYLVLAIVGGLIMMRVKGDTYSFSGSQAPALKWGFAAGLLGLAKLHGVSLVGGDLTRGPLTVTVHLLGPISPDRMLTRGGGKVGDDVYVTGSLGDSAAGLELFSKGIHEIGPHHAALIARFLKPTPRVEEGRVLSSLASAAIDISDGLLADLGHICEASDCGAVIDVGRVPLSPDLATLFPKEAAQAYALGGGDDYELCFTAAPAQAEAVERAMSTVGTAAQSIGRLVAGEGVTCQRDGETFLPPNSGYVHFSS